MTNETPALPPVYKDVITPQDAPASEKDTAERVVRAQDLRMQRAQVLQDKADTQPHPDIFRSAIEEEDTMVEYYSQQVEIEKLVKTAEGLRAKLQKLPTSQEQQAKIAQLEEVLDQSRKKLRALQEEQLAAAMYSPQYIAKQSDPDRMADIARSDMHHGVPVVTETLTGALSMQENTRTRIKEETRQRYDLTHKIAEICKTNNMTITNPEVDMPSDGCLRALMARQERDVSFSDRDLTLMIGTSIAIRTAAETYCAQHGIMFDRAKFDDQMRAGLEGMSLVGLPYNDPRKIAAERRTDDFYKRETKADHVPQLSWGVSVMAYLDEKFTREPSDADITPYTLALITGIIMDGRMNIDHIANLLISSKPVLKNNGSQGRIGFGFVLRPDLRKGRNVPFTYTDAASLQSEFDREALVELPQETGKNVTQLLEGAYQLQSVNFQVLNEIRKAFQNAR